MAGTDAGLKPLVLLASGSFVAVYALGTAAALKLLPVTAGFGGGPARRAALLALVAVVVLLVMTGWYLLWPLVITVAALGYLHLRRRSVQAVEQAT